MAASKRLTLDDVPARFEFPREEEKTLAFWNEIDAFKTSVKLSEGRPRYSFYDGPPFATGLPHYGHLLAGTIKDIVTRYAHQTGHYVERRFGWDCHGLPVEFEIDKAFDIRGRADVMAMGIDKYNAECRAIVMRYSSQWEQTVTRMGRWIDFKNDYKTLNISFMESVWWVFGQLWDKGQVYRGFKVMPFSTACNTPLSNFEAGENYKMVSDPAVTVSFPLVEDPEVSLLAWTTTPWTLPSNLALCVNPEMDYVKILDVASQKKYIMMEARLELLYKDVNKESKDKKGEKKDSDKFVVLDRFKGVALKGKEYKPMFDYFLQYKNGTNAFTVVTDNYVTADAGTGVVHQAPAFGEDDMRVCLENKIIIQDETGVRLPCPVDERGCYTDEIPEYVGVHVKDADKEIMKAIKKMDRMVIQGQETHSYPFCWRSDTPLIQKAVPSWFIRVKPIVDKLLANNKLSYWVPDFVQEKRFANWLENAHDWAVSRNRYWGTPIPLWISEDGKEVVCVHSLEELKELSGVTVTDLHRDSIDHITIPSKQGKGVLRRIEEVFDCWFESGSMPYAQIHYPFENKEVFEQSFPADFIAEGLDQTRGWFYTLLVLSTHLFDKPPFKNLIVNGLVLAADGKKMSKRLKNYPDPNNILNDYGADALRLYLINSPVVRAETLRFKEDGVKGVVKDVLLPWYNAFRFFVGGVEIFEKETGKTFSYDAGRALTSEDNVMDRWILAATQSLIHFVKTEMAAYRLYTVVPRLLLFIEQLTNWYVRLNRRRIKNEYGADDSQRALNTLFEVLFTLTKMMAPFTPFLCESMYQILSRLLPPTKENTQSVHYLLFPEVRAEYFDENIERAVGRMQAVIELGRVIRERKEISLKNPLAELVVIHPSKEFLDDVLSLESYILEELNLRKVTVTSEEASFGVLYKADGNLKALGSKYKSAMGQLRKSLSALSSDECRTFLHNKTITLNGFELNEEDVIITRYFAESTDGKYESNSDKEVLVLLDITVDQNLVYEGLAREFVNRVQRLRKKHGFKITDVVDVYYKIVTDSSSNELAFALQSQQEYFTRALKRPVLSHETLLADAKVTAQEEQEILDYKLVLTLVPLPSA